jgi:hypothetical protein
MGSLMLSAVEMKGLVWLRSLLASHAPTHAAGWRQLPVTVSSWPNMAHPSLVRVIHNSYIIWDIMDVP